jgi:hypothetical protein
VAARVLSVFCSGIGGMWDSNRSTSSHMFHGNVPSDSRIFEYCPRRIQLGWSHDARSLLAPEIIAHLKTMESQLSQKRLAWSRCSPSHIGASAIKPIWSEGSWKSLAIVLFIKTIAIKKGWGKCDQASARSILPWTNSRVLRLRAQGSILYLIPFLRMNRHGFVTLIMGAHLVPWKGPRLNPIKG